MISAIVPEARRIGIQDLLNFKEDVYCTASRTGGDSIESIVMAGADTTSLEDPTRPEIGQDGMAKKYVLDQLKSSWQKSLKSSGLF